MNLTERKRAARLQAARKALAYGYALVNLVMAFFAAWTVYGAVRLCVGLSGEIYWLSKALIQQLAIIGIMIALLVGTLIAQHGYEQAMRRKNTWLPRSFAAVSGGILLIYAVAKAVVMLY